MDRERALAASEEEVRRLMGQSFGDVRPSRRDFALHIGTQKQELAIVARVSADGAQADRVWATGELVAHARACDDAQVAALAVATGAGGVSVQDLAAIAEATTAPVLRDDLIIHPSQLYYARLHGADAAVLPLADLDDAVVETLVDTAHSLNMAVILELLGRAQVERALRQDHVLLGLRCINRNGTLDLEDTRRLADQLPCHRASLALAEIRSAAEYNALERVCDAVVVGEALLAGRVGSVLQAIAGR
jgi:indole-3-glycerol phosphate synthase